MPRAPHPDPDALSPATRAVLASLPGNNVFQTLAHADAAFPPLMALTASLWNDAALGQRQRELAILRTARLLDSDYEWMHHVEVARMVGIDERAIRAEARALMAGYREDLKRAGLEADRHESPLLRAAATPALRAIPAGRSRNLRRSVSAEA